MTVTILNIQCKHNISNTRIVTFSGMFPFEKQDIFHMLYCHWLFNIVSLKLRVARIVFIRHFCKTIFVKSHSLRFQHSKLFCGIRNDCCISSFVLCTFIECFKIRYAWWRFIVYVSMMPDEPLLFVYHVWKQTLQFQLSVNCHYFCSEL